MNHAQESPGAVILGGGFASLEAARNLDKHGVRVCVLGSAASVARFSRSVGRFVKWPRELNDEELPAFLVAMAEKIGVREWVLFPTCDEHLRVLAQHSSLLAEHFVLTTLPWETVRFLYDKRLTYTLAQKVGVPIPHTYVPGNADQLSSIDVEFPVVLKPAITSRFLEATKRKAYRADDRQELQNLYEAMLRVIPPSEVIVQDFLPEPSRNLFSFAGYYRQGELIVGLSVKRTRQLPRDFGRTSTFVVAVEVPELRELASQLLRAIHYTGLAEIEFMWNPKHARFELLEVNARLWAWHGLAVAAGLDLPYVAFADALGQNPPIGAMRQGVKWVRLLTDVRAAAKEILAGTMTVQQYLTSLRGTTVFAEFSPHDPMPLIAEPLLLLLDRLNGWASKRRHGLHLHRFASRREKGMDNVRRQGDDLKVIKTDADDEEQDI
jgi:predicted ATP-grasp superfamily ATP-dependent carboligase